MADNPSALPGYGATPSNPTTTSETVNNSPTPTVAPSSASSSSLSNSQIGELANYSLNTTPNVSEGITTGNGTSAPVALPGTIVPSSPNITPENIGNVESSEATNPVLPPAATDTYTSIDPNAAGNNIDPTTGQVANPNTITAATANTPDQVAAAQAAAGQAQSAPVTPTATYTAAQIGAYTPQAIAAQGTVDPRSLMQNQYSELMNFPPDQIPDWAKGAAAVASASMASHGLSASSMTGAAITSALMQAALPIAQNDASVFANMNLTNLSNEQQATIVNTQARVQTAMSDQAAVNASQQFNAASTNQTNQFFASMAEDVSKFNATQLSAISEFNAGQTTQASEFNVQTGQQTSQFNAQQVNAISQFNTQLAAQTSQFNANNALVIAQSNAQWQRQVNTANTAGINAANQTNATNLLNISNTAMNNIMQEMRDNANYSFTAGQNAQNRAATFAIQGLNSNSALTYLNTQYDLQSQLALGQQVGTFASNLLTNNAGAIANGIGNLLGSGGNASYDSSGPVTDTGVYDSTTTDAYGGL